MKLDRNVFPKIDGMINFIFPEYSRVELKNSSTLFFTEKRKLPIVQMQLLFNCGSNFDTTEKRGLANLFSALIDEGAGEYDALVINEKLDQLGSSIRISCNHDFIIFNFLCMKDKLDETLCILKLIITSPKFDEKDFDREKHRLLITLRQYKDEPDMIADVLFEDKIFSHANSYDHFVAGKAASLESIEISDIKNYYLQKFLNSSAVIFCAGDIEQRDIKNKVEEILPGCNSTINKYEVNLGSHLKNKIFIHDKAGSPQTEIRVGKQTKQRNEENFYSRQIANFILGGQFSSRLNLNLREKRGLTYGIRSSFNHFMNAAYFQVSTSVDVDNTGLALKEIIREVKDFRETISEEEINFAKDSIVRRFPLGFETYSQIVGWLSSVYIFDLPKNHLSQFISKINAVTKNDLMKTIQHDIEGDDTIVLVGDAQRIKNSIEKNSLYDYQLVEENFVF